VAGLAAFLFAAAKLAKRMTKLTALMKKSATAKKWVDKLGGAKATLQAMYDAARGWIASKSWTKYLTSTKALALSAFAASGLTLVGDALGIGSCVSLIRAAI
jgi:hypothetical protein